MLTRRQFVAVSSIAGVAIATGCVTRKRSSWQFLNEKDAQTLTAICDQIIPADDFPSASQAGVLTYIDRQLIRHYKRHQNAYRDGLDKANQISQQKFGVELTSASVDQQFVVVGALEQQNHVFFELVRSHTMQGYYGSPRHGGNRDAISWRMLQLDEPPLRGRAQYDFTKGPQG